MGVGVYIQVALEIWGILLCLIVGVVSFHNRKINGQEYLKLSMVSFDAVILQGFDILAHLYRNDESVIGGYVMRVSCFGVFYMQLLVLYLFARYALAHMEKPKSESWLWAIRVPIDLCALMLIVSQWTGWIYWFDERNHYHRGVFYAIYIGVAAVAFVALFAYLIRHRQRTSGLRRISMMIMIWYTLVSAAVQLLVIGVPLLNLGVSITVFFLFVIAEIDQSRQLVERSRILSEQQAEISKLRIRMMISQIQPHFLYNVLNTIYYLCETDPKKAQDAIDVFSDYLRGNLVSLETETPVPIDEELSHVRTYFNLEKLRFEDELQVEYDICTHEVVLPLITIQQIVENAIKHGIAKKQNGGRIVIGAKEETGGYSVTIKDDGVGFDTAILSEAGHKGIGIENVQNRLKSMVGGELTIQSTIGEGTECRIFIPKSEGVS